MTNSLAPLALAALAALSACGGSTSADHGSDAGATSSSSGASNVVGSSSGGASSVSTTGHEGTSSSTTGHGGTSSSTTGHGGTSGSTTTYGGTSTTDVTSSGSSSGSATCGVIQASAYDQTCTQDSDCVGVQSGNICPAGCGCANDAINKSAETAYYAAFPNIQQKACPCAAPHAYCSASKCTYGFPPPDAGH